MIPQETRNALRRYSEDRIPTGGFLYSVLSNDLAQSCNRADLPNRAALYDIVHLIWQTVPMEAWGSPDKVNAWLSGRLN